jgi:hypothetical protein
MILWIFSSPVIVCSPNPQASSQYHRSPRRSATPAAIAPLDRFAGLGRQPEAPDSFVTIPPVTAACRGWVGVVGPLPAEIEWRWALRKTRRLRFYCILLLIEGRTLVSSIQVRVPATQCCLPRTNKLHARLQRIAAPVSVYRYTIGSQERAINEQRTRRHLLADPFG